MIDRSSEDQDQLSSLREEARVAYKDAVRHATLGAERALVTGAALAQARPLCPEGDWSVWLTQAGIPDTSAQACLELHRLGFEAPAIVALGGVALAAAWASKARLPSADEALIITLGRREPALAVPVVYIWRPPEGLCAALTDTNYPRARMAVIPDLMTQEREFWASVWHLLGHRYSEMSFQPVRERVGSIVETLEAQRQAAVVANTPTFH